MPKKLAAKAENMGNIAGRVMRSATRFDSVLGKIPNSELAAQIAGTSDKKSKEYKAAIRNLQRYQKGERKPKEAAKKEIEKAARKIVKQKPEKAERLIGGGTVTASGIICYSDDCRRRTIEVKMSPSAMGEFLRASKESSARAEEVLFEFYDVPGMSIQSGKVSVKFDQ